MAFGFTPKHIEDLPLNKLSQEQFLVVAIEAAEKINWKIVYVSENGLIAYTNNGLLSWNAEIHIKIEDGSANIKSASSGNDMFDWGKNKKNVEAFISEFATQKNLLSKEDIEVKFEELKTNFVPDEEDILKLPEPTFSEQVVDFFSIFRPTEGYFITPILLNINLLIFLLMIFSGVNIMEPDNQSLINWGANSRSVTLEGEWWRILTNCFLHIGIFHLIMNMYALIYIGMLLEPYLGKSRFLSAYLLSGIAASIMSLFWHDMAISAGASGAIFGMYGVFLAMLTTNLIEKSMRKALLVSISIFVVFNLINGLKGGIDNAAHIGGLVAGIIIGYAFIPSLKNSETRSLKLATIGILSVLILASSYMVYNFIPKPNDDLKKYDKAMTDFIDMERMALYIYQMPQETPKNEFLAELKDRGLYYWNENLKLINDVEKLSLPDEIHQRNAILKEYCELRIKSYEIIYKMVDDDMQKDREQLNIYNKRIDELLKSNIFNPNQ